MARLSKDPCCSNVLKKTYLAETLTHCRACAEDTTRSSHITWVGDWWSGACNAADWSQVVERLGTHTSPQSPTTNASDIDTSAQHPLRKHLDRRIYTADSKSRS